MGFDTIEINVVLMCAPPPSYQSKNYILSPNSSFNNCHDILRWNVNLAQLVSSNAALPAKLVLESFKNKACK